MVFCYTVTMLLFTPLQRRVIATGLTLMALTAILAFPLLVGWALLTFLQVAVVVVAPVLVGLFLAMLVKPYFSFVERMFPGHPKLVLTLVLASVLVPLVLICWFGGSMVQDQVSHIAHSLAKVLPKAFALLGVEMPKDWTSVLADMERLGDNLFGDALKFFKSAMLHYFMGVGSALLTFVFFVYFLKRRPLRGMDCVRQLPFLKKSTRAFIAKQIDVFFEIVGNFFQRQVLICLIEGVFYGLGFMLVGLDNGFIIGFLLGVLNLVPLLGSLTCLPPALFLSYFGMGEGDVHPVRLAGVALVWLTGQFLDVYVIAPKIQGQKMGLGYVAVIFSFFFWGGIFHSITGLLLAIPLSAFCVVFWRAVKEKYLKGMNVI